MQNVHQGSFAQTLAGSISTTDSTAFCTVVEEPLFNRHVRTK